MTANKDNNLIRDLKDSTTREKAFSRLLDLYQEKIYWHIRKMVLNHDNANDVLQNTFVRVFKYIEKFKGNSSLQTWIYKIAYNESVRFLNKNKMKLNSIDEVNIKYLENLTDDVYFDGDEIQVKLQEVISQLTEKQRLVFQMKYFDDLTFKQISEILKQKESTLKSSYYYSVKIIEEKMTS